jgi:hypothetical protein
MALEDSDAVYVLFRKDQDKRIFALFPLHACHNDTKRCQTAELVNDELKLSCSGYEQFVRNKRVPKPKEYRDILHKIKDVFGSNICVVQHATDYMHMLRAARVKTH